MDAIKLLKDKGYDVRIRFVGDGPKLEEFKTYAKSLGIDDKVEFTGRLSDGASVRRVISDTDIFVLPTFAEGLPRALLEAMSEGLPCLSSPICGIPEVLSKDFLYDFADSNGFAIGIERFITNPELMTKVGYDNLKTAQQFKSSRLNMLRTDFYKKLRVVAESTLTK